MITIRIAAVSIILFTSGLTSAQEPTVLKHDGWVAAVAFAPDGKTLASAGADNVVRLWEVGSWKPKGVLKGHTDCVCAISFPSSDSLVTGSFDRHVKIWDKKKAGETLDRHEGGVTALAARGYYLGAFVATGSLDGAVRLWNSSKTPQIIHQHKSWVNGISLHGEEAIASGSSDGTVCILVPESKDEKLSFKATVLEGGAGEVRCVAFNPDGKLLAAGNRYGTVRVWDVASRKEVKTITGHIGDVWSIAFSPDGKTLAAVDTDWKKPSKIKLYDTATWKERGSLPCPGEILSIAYSPRGDWLAAGSWDKTVRIFKLEPGAK